MENRSRLELANDNAAAFWLAQARVHGWETLVRPGFTAVRCDRDAADVHRVVVTRPYDEPEALERELVQVFRDWGTTRLCLEDPYGKLDLTRYHCEAGLGLPVMVREPHAEAQPLRAAPPAGLRVDEAVDADAFAEVERAVVDGFPIPPRQPWRRGEFLTPALLDQPGYRAWLATVDGDTAGACMTYDDGTAVGVYWVATLPVHRSKGVARAVVDAALAAAEGKPATLVATLLGEPLYKRLGFTEQGVTRWWRLPGLSPDVPLLLPEADTAAEAEA
ncbi:GNAT family N-acetyltransferase [Kitasatospora camelliae]|uniref:GNAT family N-acetyltransferase n=1 Tax=Kitasatospora camelliae TaxID=3156397 RepID=A0AAU8JXD4_9ACTN